MDDDGLLASFGLFRKSSTDGLLQTWSAFDAFYAHEIAPRGQFHENMPIWVRGELHRELTDRGALPYYPNWGTPPALLLRWWRGDNCIAPDHELLAYIEAELLTRRVLTLDANGRIAQRRQPPTIKPSPLAPDTEDYQIDWIDGLENIVERGQPAGIIGDDDSGKSTVAETYLVPLILSDYEQHNGRPGYVVRVATDYPEGVSNPAAQRMEAAGVPRERNLVLSMTDWQSDLLAIEQCTDLAVLVVDNIQEFVRLVGDWEVGPRLDELLRVGGGATQLWLSHRPGSTQLDNKPRSATLGSRRYRNKNAPRARR